MFLPLIAITGVTGVFFRALAITVGVSLLTSLGLALTWTPTLSQYFIHRRTRDAAPRSDLSEKDKLLAAEEAALSGRFRRVIDFYERWLRFALDRPRWIALFSAVLVIAVLLLLQGARAPTCCRRWTKAASCWTTSRPPGTSLEETNRMVSHIERNAPADPRGRELSRGAPAWNSAWLRLPKRTGATSR